MRRKGIFLLSLVVFGLVAVWTAGSVMTRGSRDGVTAASAPARDLTIDAPDGVTIAATYTPGRGEHAPAVLLLHGLGASRQATAGNAAWLAGLGYATLTIDFRGHGQSTTATRTFGLRDALDARAAFDWLKRQQNGAPVAVIGISLGGAASLIGKAGPLPADALILQAVYPDIRRAIRNRITNRLPVPVSYALEPLLSFQAPLRFGVWPSSLAPVDAIATYNGAVLVIGGQQDRLTPPAESREIFAAVEGPRELWLVPSADHAAICSLADAEYRSRVRAFIERTIGPAPS